MLRDRAAAFELLDDEDGAVEELDDSVRAASLAVDSVAVGHPVRGLYLSGLGNSLAARFRLTGNVGDLNDAVRLSPPSTPGC